MTASGSGTAGGAATGGRSRRVVLLVAHTGRDDVAARTRVAAKGLIERGFQVRMLADEALDAGLVGQEDVEVVEIEYQRQAAEGAEFALVFGGDGTFLRACELVHDYGTPLLGVNLGHVGFLAEAEPGELEAALDAIAGCVYTVDRRVTLDVEVLVDGEVKARTWALNEASVEKSSRERLLEIAVRVDRRPLLRFGCDGVLCATPTGSTAYAFSAGGPIVWPDVDALLVVPNAAHAVFSRPLVLSPGSVVEMELLRSDHPGVLSCDGRRSVDLPPGCVVVVRKSPQPIAVARLLGDTFAERLVAKFGIPVRGFRDESP